MNQFPQFTITEKSPSLPEDSNDHDLKKKVKKTSTNERALKYRAFLAQRQQQNKRKNYKNRDGIFACGYIKIKQVSRVVRSESPKHKKWYKAMSDKILPSDHCKNPAWLNEHTSLYYVLNQEELTIYESYRSYTSCSPRDSRKLSIVSGKMWSKKPNGIQFRTKEGMEFKGIVQSKSELVHWVTAFYRLKFYLEDQQKENIDTEEPVNEIDMEEVQPESPAKRKVTFLESVRIRSVPTMSKEEADQLFYSKKDVIRFARNANSIRSRTGDAVLHACQYLKIKKKHSSSQVLIPAEGLLSKGRSSRTHTA